MDSDSFAQHRTPSEGFIDTSFLGATSAGTGERFKVGGRWGAMSEGDLRLPDPGYLPS